MYNNNDGRDEEGLLHRYDVVVCGTGLVQSILASALSRAGQQVLHCDGAYSYGELNGTIELNDSADSVIHEKKQSGDQSTEISDYSPSAGEEMISMNAKGGESTLEWHSQSRVEYFGFDVGSDVNTPFGIGTVSKIPKKENDSLIVALKTWVLANGKTSLAYFRLPGGYPRDSCSSRELEKMFFEAHGVQSLRTAAAKHILKNEHRFSLDATPAFVLATGTAVSCILESNVADYLEFRSAEGVLWMDDGRLSKVPSSKNDVFATKLLAPMEKRRLMKFIQFAMDYAARISYDEERLHQTHLGDENKAVGSPSGTTRIATTAVETEVQSLNERHLNHGRSLARPQNKVVSTEAFSNLRQCIDDGMVFDTFLAEEYNLSPKLRAIVRYAIAWEREESSVSLAEGMRNLKLHLQAIGRFGNTAFIYPLYGSAELPQAFCRSAAVFGATYLLRRAPIGIRVSDDNQVNGVLVSGDNSTQCKMIECTAVVASSASFPPPRTTKPCKRVLRRISVLNGKVIPSSDTDCHITIIPPKSQPIDNSHTIHCVTLDHTLHVVPPGCSVMHLTTTVECDEGWEQRIGILSQASSMIIAASGNKVDEVYEVSFSHVSEPTEQDSASDIPEGLYCCHHSGQALPADDAFAQAERIFSQLCPGTEFLRLSEDFDARIRERATERINDDEKDVLESALDIVKKHKEMESAETVPSSFSG